MRPDVPRLELRPLAEEERICRNLPRWRRNVFDRACRSGQAKLVFVASAVLLSACGTANPAPVAVDGNGRALSEADLIRQGDAICAESNLRIEAATKDLVEAPFGENYANNINEVLMPELSRRVADLASLRPSNEESIAYERFVAEMQSVLDRIESDPSVLYATIEDPFVRANKMAIDFGFDVCGDD